MCRRVGAHGKRRCSSHFIFECLEISRCTSVFTFIRSVQVVFTPDGRFVISAGADGLLCLHSACGDYELARVMAGDQPAPGRTISLAVSTLTSMGVGPKFHASAEEPYWRGGFWRVTDSLYGDPLR